jgi:FdrA protein
VSASVRCLVHRDTYRDSVELMRVAAEVEKLAGVSSAALLMGTPANREMLARAGLLVDEAASAGPNDLVVAVAALNEQVAEEALTQAARLLTSQPASQAASTDRPPPRTLAEALEALPGANLAIISTPGPYATAEALKALKRGLHVFLFSDNVSIDDEIELKHLARKKGLLVMGPDCGTAILDGVPIGFANAVRRGWIGLVGASGTGLQQVSCLVDRLGEGVSQVIGVGSHDLRERVGGPMMLAGIERLAADPETAVIVLVSKPPAETVARNVLEAAVDCGKPVVANFLGGDPAAISEAGARPAETLEEAARVAVSLVRGGDSAPSSRPPPPRGRGSQHLADDASEDSLGPVLFERLAQTARQEAARLAPGQHHVRGLYSGGTLCQEAALILTKSPAAGRQPPSAESGHTMIDLGADEYTVGRPHPMIDFRLRNEQILAAADDPSSAVVLLDVVLGYGSHPDPAEALLPAIEEARRRAQDAQRYLPIIASVCGTPADPQGLTRQEARLAEVGVILAPSNAQAARLAALLVRQVMERELVS